MSVLWLGSAGADCLLGVKGYAVRILPGATCREKGGPFTVLLPAGHVE